MKQGWEYKRLREIGHIVTGSTPSTKDETNYSPREYCFVKPSDLPSQGIALIEETEYYVSSKGLSKSRVLPTGSVLVSCIGSIGKIGILTKEACSNQQINAIIPKNDIDSKFIAYSIYAYRFLLESIANAPVVPIINKTDFSKIQIPLPPKFTQLSIVSELDKINELIRLKKEQLKDYDKLAQSIFYEMFGDPVENEKGWEVKKIGEIGSVERGAGISKKDFVEDGLPCIHYGQLHTILEARTKKHYTSIPHDLLPKYKVAHTGDLVMAITSEDVEGSCKSTAWLGNYDVIVGSDAAILHHEQDGTFLSYYTMTKAFYNEKAKYAKGFKVTHISTKEIEKISVFLPPLPLQHLFAQRIEQIERQKSAVQKSITDLETILASRMQYWFE